MSAFHPFQTLAALVCFSPKQTSARWLRWPAHLLPVVNFAKVDSAFEGALGLNGCEAKIEVDERRA